MGIVIYFTVKRVDIIIIHKKIRYVVVVFKNTW